MKDTTCAGRRDHGRRDLPTLARHMGQQQAIRDLEDKLDEHIAEPRDMSTPEGAREFFIKSFMELLVSRRHDD